MMEQAPRPRSPPVPPHLKPSDGNDDSINNTSNENTDAVSSTNVTCQEEVQQPPLQSTFRQRRLTATKREMGSAAAAAAALAFVSNDDDDDDDRKSENDDNNAPHKPSTNDTTTTGNSESVSRVTSGTETVVESTEMNRLGGSFRERRLSGYKRDMGTAAAAAAAAAAFDLSDNDDDDNDDNDKVKEQETNVMPTEEPPAGNQEKKSNSFRQRRLSGYKRDMGTAAAAAAAAAAFDLSDSDDDDDNKNNSATPTSVPQDNAATKADSGSTNMNQLGSPQRKRPRTLSSAPKSTTATPTAAPSMKHMHMTQGFLCAIRTKLNNSKVRRPSKTLAEEKVGKEVWKKDANEPFKSNVVGTFSCHGIEPLYEDEMENGTNANAMDKDVVLKISTTTPGEAVGVSGAFMSDKDTVVAKINQDRGGVAYPYANDLRTALFAAYDGHGEGGELVAQFTMTEVQKRLESHADYNGDVAKAFKQTFVEVDEALGNQEDIDPLYSGTTACVVLLRNEQLYIANAGDSRAVMARRINNESLLINPIKTAMHAIDLSVDQNPDSPGEQQRIERCGGFVSPPPEPGLSARVWLDPGFTHIGLAMARSIGDHAVKSVGVISEPVVTTHTLHNNDEFMIIATDGVWEFITSDEAVKIVAKHFDEEGKGDASIACQDLIETAALRWKEHEGDYRDDITAVVVKVKELWDKI